MPINYTSGTMLERWPAICPLCHKDVGDDQVRGTVTMPLGTVAVIEATGICQDCKHLFPFKVRVRDDISLEWVDNRGVWMKADLHGVRPLNAPPPIRKRRIRIPMRFWFTLALVVTIAVLSLRGGH